MSLQIGPGLVGPRAVGNRATAGATAPSAVEGVAAGSGSCLVLAAAAVWASFILDPGGPGADRTWAGLMLMLGLYAVVAGVWILGSGVSTPVPRGSGRQLPR